MSKRKDRAEESAQDEGVGGGKAEAALDELMDGLDEAHAYLKRHWEERPVAVAATALAVGVVIGLMLGRRR